MTRPERRALKDKVALEKSRLMQVGVVYSVILLVEQRFTVSWRDPVVCYVFDTCIVQVLQGSGPLREPVV